MDTVLDLTGFEMDALKECANVGIGNAATALSKLLSKKIDIQIPVTQFVPIEDFSKLLGGSENIVAGINLEIHGDLEGDVIFIFPKKDAISMINLLFNKSTDMSSGMSELEESGFKEMSNIVTGSYLNALADMLDLKILPGVPRLAVDMAQALVDAVLIGLGKHSDRILTTKTKIRIEDHGIDGIFIMIFTIDSLKKIISALHSKYGF